MLANPLKAEPIYGPWASNVDDAHPLEVGSLGKVRGLGTSFRCKFPRLKPGVTGSLVVRSFQVRGLCRFVNQDGYIGVQLSASGRGRRRDRPFEPAGHRVPACRLLWQERNGTRSQNRCRFPCDLPAVDDFVWAEYRALSVTVFVRQRLCTRTRRKRTNVRFIETICRSPPSQES